MQKKSHAKAEMRRPSYPMSDELVAGLEMLVTQGLAGNQPLNQSIVRLTQRLKVRGRYGIKLSATLIPLEDEATQP